MTVWIGGAGGRQVLVDPQFGDGPTRRPVQKIWVGDSASVPMLVFQRTATLALSAAAASSSQINLAWTDLGPGWTYNVDSNPYGRIVTGSASTSFAHTGIAPSTFVAYRVDAYYGGAKQQEAHANATTAAATTQQRTWSGNAVQSASYNGSNVNRGVAECYYGYYSGTNGVQRSLARWDFPAEVRNCVSIDAVELHWYNLHHFQNAGGQVSLVVHHSGDVGGNFPGATERLRNPSVAGDPIVGWAAPKPGPIGGDTPTDRFHVGWLHAANRPSVAEEIRVQGATGFGLVDYVGGTAGYGYARGATQGPITCYLTYTVRTG